MEKGTSESYGIMQQSHSRVYVEKTCSNEHPRAHCSIEPNSQDMDAA